MKEPTLLEIMQVVYHQQKLSWEDLDSMQARMTKAAWFPALSLGFDQLFKQTTQNGIEDNISVSGSGIVVGPQGSDWQINDNKGSHFEVKAMWKLDQLVFPHDQLAFIHTRQRQLQLRQDLFEQIAKIYSERQKLVAVVGGTKFAMRKKILIQINLYTDKLNALTEGAFENRWRTYED